MSDVAQGPRPAVTASTPARWVWEAAPHCRDCGSLGGPVLRPVHRDEARCAKHLEDGAVYHLEPVEEGLSARDKAFHASLRDVWKSLPGVPEEGVSSYDDFRKFCLIKCGFYFDKTFQFPSQEAAEAALVMWTYMGREYSVIICADSQIVVRRALSQSGKGGMPKDMRLQSYQEVQEYASSLISDEAYERLRLERQARVTRKQEETLMLSDQRGEPKT